jgi:hypothetical protein
MVNIVKFDTLFSWGKQHRTTVSLTLLTKRQYSSLFWYFYKLSLFLFTEDDLFYDKCQTVMQAAQIFLIQKWIWLFD